MFHIPCIGDVIKLTQPWSFTCETERRNNDFLVFMGVMTYDEDTYSPFNKYMIQAGTEFSLSFPIGTTLRVDRIYIRKGLSGFDSVSFWVSIPNKKKKQRFWVKVSEANKIIGEWEE